MFVSIALLLELGRVQVLCLPRDPHTAAAARSISVYAVRIAGSRAASAARARESEPEGGRGRDGGPLRQEVQFAFRPYMKAAERAALVHC